MLQDDGPNHLEFLPARPWHAVGCRSSLPNRSQLLPPGGACQIAFPTGSAAAFGDGGGGGGLGWAEVVAALVAARQWRGLEDLLEHCAADGPGGAAAARAAAVSRVLEGAEFGVCRGTLTRTAPLQSPATSPNNPSNWPRLWV